MYLVYRKEIDSTQLFAKQIFNKINDKIIVVVAESQSSGMGRNSRSWMSSPGGLYFTLVLKDIKLPDPVSAYIPLALTDFFYEKYKIETSIKWPNDIYFNSKKLCGILIDNIINTNLNYRFIGIGINYNNIINKSSAGADCISLSEIIGEPIGLSSIKESTELSLKILDTSKYFLNNENNIIEKYSEKSIVLNKVVEIILSDGSIIKSEVKKIGINGELILSSGENILNAERLRLL